MNFFKIIHWQTEIVKHAQKHRSVLNMRLNELSRMSFIYDFCMMYSIFKVLVSLP